MTIANSIPTRIIPVFPISSATAPECGENHPGLSRPRKTMPRSAPGAVHHRPGNRKNRSFHSLSRKQFLMPTASRSGSEGNRTNRSFKLSSKSFFFLPFTPPHVALPVP